ncbi:MULTISPECIES: universal stress protein [unclassified Nocardioides]|uniref:universal stress protein n=1 Tax=unclassified Nocardioides TaxID=2615069 RepID=UPI0006FACDC4|nr:MULTISPECIES: universal stress protein [unclassified Nocardioides]KQY54563.1 hypothetical protein ASD30_18125 [Nocardioides sp. Root140]KQZ66438.1 hypothetical protein ASD66_23210 [Nocardioides sp. Root151]KRF19638.1 hypothetical protein ASH02_24085 [Nocardioides sp. Soil796]
MAGVRDQLNRDITPEGGVVVGDDGSRSAAAAITYAVGEAARRGCAVHVIRAWTFTSAIRPDDVPLGITPSMLELEEATLEAEKARVAGIVGDSAIEVHVHVACGPSAQALIKAAETADVLVVGSRGRGGFKSLVLGSVADQCIRHASGPVVVVRD